MTYIKFALFFSILFSFSCDKKEKRQSNTLEFRRLNLGKLKITDLSNKKEITFLSFGDSGTGELNQYIVGRAMSEVCEKLKCDFALMLGDNFYKGHGPHDGVTSKKDPKFYYMFEAPYKRLHDKRPKLHIWSSLGNHDYSKNILKNINSQIKYSKKSKMWRMPYRYYAIPKLPKWLHLFAFDTEIITEEATHSSSGDPLQEVEARNFLCSNKLKGWKMAFGHNPFFSYGPRGSHKGVYKRSNQKDMDAMAKYIYPILKDCGVSFYYSGHDHVLEHLTLNNEIEQIVTGASSSANSLLEDDPNHPYGETYYPKIFSRSDSIKRNYVKGDRLSFTITTVSKTNVRLRFFELLNNSKKLPKSKIKNKSYHLKETYSWSKER